MILGFWNIQRAGSLNSKKGNSAPRAWLVAANVDLWIRGVPWRAPRPFDVLVLAEVPQAGPSLIGYFNQTFPEYEASYIPVKDSAGGTSPCSFIVMHHRQRAPWSAQPATLGGSIRRPGVVLHVGPLQIIACHLIANRAKAPSEVLDIATEVAAAKVQRSIIIGDLNCPFDEFPDYEAKFMSKVGFAKINPGVSPTFKSSKPRSVGAVLDYAWRRGAFLMQALPPELNGTDFDVIDHAPIAYEV